MSACHAISSPLAALRRLAWLPLLGLLAALAALPGPVRAGNLPGELPGLVGRLNVLAGEAQLQDRDSGRWDGSAAGDAGPLRNWPVAEGDRLRLRGRDARAELRIGSTTLRLGAGTELWLQQLDGQAVVLQLQDGTLAVHLAAIDGDAFGPVEVRTREGRWLPRRPGHYRLDRESDATQAGVWRGELQFEGFDSALTIPEGRRADLWLDGPEGRRSATRYAWAPVQRDGFADWVARDERHDDAPQTARHVPPGITGWQDLDRHGDWIADSDQGPLWLPRAVPAGWAPFQVGRWAWVAPWGWTWINAAPWGFAPFHYGSWLRFDGRWAWSPGRGEPHWRGHRDPRVRYAPALGAWIGGPAVGITVQIGGQRPPPPRVVVPTVPVVVVRPGHSHPHPLPPPAVVLPVRPDRQGDDRRHDERRSDERRHDERRWDDRRPDDRRWDGRAGPRGEHRFDGPGDRPQDAPRTGRPIDRAAAPVAPVVQAPASEQPRMTVPRPQPRVPQAAAPVAAPVVAPVAAPVAAPVRPPRAADDGPRGAGRERHERAGDGDGRRAGPGRINDRDMNR